MSSVEFATWAAYDQLSPIGNERFDYLMAMLATLMANLWGRRRYKLRDFLPQWGMKRRKKGSTPQEIWAWALAVKNAQERMEKHGRSVN